MRKRVRKDRGSLGWQVALLDFPWALPYGNPLEKPFQPLKTPSFPPLLLRLTQYIVVGR